MIHYLARSVKLLIKSSFLLIPLLLIPLLVYAPIEEDFDRSKTECLFYTPKEIPEIHYFYEVYHPWPYDKQNWGN